MKVSALAVLLLALGPGPRAEPTVADLAWMAGHWRGEGFGGRCEEIWSEPLGGTMVGTFRLVKDGRVEFYEIMVLGPEGDGTALKVKHFSSEFRSWEDAEEAVVFPLQSLDGQTAVFDGLRIERTGDRLEIRLHMRSKDGSTRWEPLGFDRYVPGS